MATTRNCAAIMVIALIVFGCGESASQTKQAVNNEKRVVEGQAVSEIFKTQMVKFLEAGGKLSAKSSQGISILELNEQLANAKTAYALLAGTWPTAISTDCKVDFEKAINGWELTLIMWKLKVDQQFPITELDGSIYKRFSDYAGDMLIVNVYGKEAPENEKRGKKFLPQIPNVSVLLKIASASFEQGRDKILPLLR